MRFESSDADVPEHDWWLVVGCWPNTAASSLFVRPLQRAQARRTVLRNGSEGPLVALA